MIYFYFGTIPQSRLGEYSVRDESTCGNGVLTARDRLKAGKRASERADRGRWKTRKVGELIWESCCRCLRFTLRRSEPLAALCSRAEGRKQALKPNVGAASCCRSRQRLQLSSFCRKCASAFYDLGSGFLRAWPCLSSVFVGTRGCLSFHSNGIPFLLMERYHFCTH